MESTILEDWKNAINQDTPARAVAQGLSRATGAGFGYAKQADIPAADQAAYASGAAKPMTQPGQPAAATGLGLPGYGNEGRTTRQAIDANLPKLGLQQWNPVGQKPYDIAKTSEPGISRITGNGLSSPLYTNLNNVNQAVDGLNKPGIASGLPGYGAQAASQGITSTPFSAVNAGSGAVPGIAAGMPEGLARQAKANAITQQLIDAQPQGGIGILPDQAERDNADMQRMRMNSRIDDLMSGIKYGKRSERSASASALGALAGADTQRAVEGMRQQSIAAGLDLQRRGQDIGQAAEAAKLGLTLRGQDMESQRNDARLGLDIGRLGIENQRLAMDQEEAKRRQDFELAERPQRLAILNQKMQKEAFELESLKFQQQARLNLLRAIRSGDKEAVAYARQQAAAAGVDANTIY